MTKPEGIEITGALTPEFAAILTPEALRFTAELARQFEPTRLKLLEARQIRQGEIDRGQMPDFLSSTQKIRESAWKVGPIPKDLLQRKVEITGPAERKMIVNALNSGADIFMADFEYSNSPTWKNNV